MKLKCAADALRLSTAAPAAPTEQATDRTGRLIEAAEAYAHKNYLDDDRQDIVTDVLNAFYQGAHYAWNVAHIAQQAAPAAPESKDVIAALPKQEGK